MSGVTSLRLKPCKDHPCADAVNPCLQGLVKGIQAQLVKYETKRQQSIPSKRWRTIQSILNQIQHCFLYLHQQQLSLVAGLDCLQQVVWPQVLQQHISQLQQKKNKGDWTRVIEHVFGFMLRLHDGLILCISGECRHESDKRRVRKFPYPSRLGKATTTSSTKPAGEPHQKNAHASADGYTQLYASSRDRVYSGTSWDEFNDPVTGLKQRLWEAVRPFVAKSYSKETWWDSLVETKAMALEQFMVATETRATMIQDSFSNMVQSFPVQLQRKLAEQYATDIKVQLKFADKMEQWHVVAGKERLCLERYAKDFQIRDVAGVLPPFRTVGEWKEVMNLPDPKICNKRKRRIVESDDDGEEKDEGTSRKFALKARKPPEKEALPPAKAAAVEQGIGTTTGLKVKHVKTAKSNKENNDCSIAAIKQQMGVDVDGLVRSREELEAEEQVTNQSAQIVDDAPVDLSHDYNETVEDEILIQQAEGRVKRLNRELKRVLQLENRGQDVLDSNQYEKEVWDARERLREASMEAGNQLLWSMEPEKRLERVSRSILYFKQARALVEAQQRLHVDMDKENALGSTEDSRFFRRNLVLILGQAIANIGIAKVEETLVLGRNNAKKRIQLEEASQILGVALGHAQNLVLLANVDVGDGCDEVEARVDSIRAYQLQSLSNRWIGILRWHQGNRQLAFDSFEKAGKAPTEVQIFENDALHESQIDLQVERYYAWTTLADMASESLERASISSLREYAASYAETFDRTISALQEAEKLCTNIQNFLKGTTWKSFSAERGLLTEDVLKQTCSDLQEWWERKKDSCRKIIANPPRNASSELPRNDLLPDGPDIDESPPTARLVLDNRRNKKPKRKPGVGYSNIGNTNHSIEVRPSPPPKTRKYRKWGDELLPHTVDEKGRIIPELPYPSRAPAMPAEIQAFLKQQSAQ